MPSDHYLMVIRENREGLGGCGVGVLRGDWMTGDTYSTKIDLKLQKKL